MQKIIFSCLLLLLIKICDAQIVLNSNAAKVQAQYLADQYLQTKTIDGLQMQCVFETQSPVAHHYTFQCMHNGIPLFGNKLHINLANDGKLLSINSTIVDAKNVEHIPFYFNAPTVQRKIKSNLQSVEYPVYYFSKQQFVPAICVHTTNTSTDMIRIVDEHQQVLFEQDIAQHYTKDSTLTAKVFLPDPLTSAKKLYGGFYVDSNDMDLASLNAERIAKSFPVTFVTDSNKFLMENKYVKLKDFALPFVAIASPSFATVDYTRNQSGFEDVNVMYHITAFHQYIDSLGFASLLSVPITVDPHGQNGADNSVFVSSGAFPTLDMGTGGVDDAEDADVIIHEYAHALSWAANGNTVMDAERSSLSEGISDYFATSYSKAIDTFRWANMFTWDGHNTFWNGRTATTAKQYALPFVLGLYQGGEVWNAAMMKIWDRLGHKLTDKLMLQAMYSLTDNSTFGEAAAYVLQADSLYYNSAHQVDICQAFRSKNIEPSWGCWPTSIAEHKNNTNVQITNQLEFANRIGDLHISTSAKNVNIIIANMFGQQVFVQDFYSPTIINISPSMLPPGVYQIAIRADAKTFYQTIIQY
jgi:zinc metalloprotease ZmpB